MKPNIYAKAALCSEQINTKLSIGCDGIEIQLLDELTINRQNGIYRAAANAYDLTGLRDVPVSAVHAPLMCDDGYITLETIIDPKDMKLLEQIFSIANYYGMQQNKNIPVILHSEVFYYMLADMGNMWARVVRSVDAVLSRFQRTELLIENVTPLRGIAEGRTLHLSNNFTFDNVRLAVELRNLLKTTRIGTCLDVCHAMISKQYVDGIYKVLNTLPAPDLCLEEYYQQNVDVLKLVHLSTFSGNGYGDGQHSIGFTRETATSLCEILRMHSQFAETVPITIATVESDYAKSTNYRDTKRLVDEYYA